MKALILNSGLGMRMGDMVREHPKCMTDLSATETILSRQLKILCKTGISDIIMTTGYFDKVLVDYCYSLNLPIKFTFVKNPLYNETNYIYSIFCAKDYLENQNILLLHGDLVFEQSVISDIISFNNSCMKISSTLPLPEKDFKAVLDNGKIKKVGVDFFGKDAVEAQALYKMQKDDWNIWLDRICDFCQSGKCKCYAEAAFNEISDKCTVYGFDVRDRLCAEIDTLEDLEIITKKLATLP